MCIFLVFTLISRFGAYLASIGRSNAGKVLIVSITTSRGKGLNFFFLSTTPYDSLACLYHYSHLVVLRLILGVIVQVFFSVFTGAFSLGQSIPNIESVLTAGGVAGAIFDIIQRVILTVDNFVGLKYSYLNQ